MKKVYKYLVLVLFAWGGVLMFSSQLSAQSENIFTPLSFEEADEKADSVLKLMTLDEKIALVGGDRIFFIRPFPRLNLSEVYLTDATQGVHIREEVDEIDISDYQLEKSTAFPCPISLAATWNPELSYNYAKSVGEECRAGGIGVLLGPGMNIYRISQCGRNFEYFGEDPFLASRMIEKYVKGVQSTGTVATLKHFVANNTDYYRRRSNSVVDERALNEIYLPAFKAGVDAGAKAVMTAYNLLNGEWCGQSENVINNILREQLGFKWMVMTDWWSVDDGEELAKSGQDLEMPFAIALKDAKELIDNGKVKVEDINRMAKSILRVYFAMKLNGRKKEPNYEKLFKDHELVALQTAREGMILLKNDGDILPIKKEVANILITGDYVETLAMGGGSATVNGYNIRLMLDELKKEFGDRINYVKNPSIDQIKSADVLICNVGTSDSEGWDRPFELPEDQEKKVKDCVNNNPNTIVVVTSGSGIRMTDWNDKAKAIIYAWYGGQIGNVALVEIISGKINPSGKLPMTIERDFKDSPGYGYIPEGEELYSGWLDDKEYEHPVFDVNYNEDVFVGYRWYQSNGIETLYNFGHGLSYTTYEYSDIRVSSDKFNSGDDLSVSFTIKNTGNYGGMETAQLYVQDIESSIPRPIKELKGFVKVDLKPGESKTVQIKLDKKDFSFWDTNAHNWLAEKGKFIIHIGASSSDVKLKKEVELL